MTIFFKKASKHNEIVLRIRITFLFSYNPINLNFLIFYGNFVDNSRDYFIIMKLEFNEKEAFYRMDVLV